MCVKMIPIDLNSGDQAVLNKIVGSVKDEHLAGLFIQAFVLQKFLTSLAELVAEHGTDEVGVRTFRVFDGELPFETMVKHPAYANGTPCPVQAYATKEEAEIGHRYWTAKFISGLPETIRLSTNSHLAKMLAEMAPETRLVTRDRTAKAA
jgi:hypothetical protein